MNTSEKLKVRWEQEKLFSKKSSLKVSVEVSINLCKDIREEVYGVFLESEMIRAKKELRISTLRTEALERH